MPPDLRSELARRVVVADGAMGTMLQAHDLALDDFQGHEGCNEVLNVTRPDVVRAVHDAYFDVGVDCVETNTFGANWANLAEYGIEDRIDELAGAGAAIAREAADGWSTPDRPRWVLGSVGPGTKLPTLGHAPYALLRDAYEAQVAAWSPAASTPSWSRRRRTCCRRRRRSSAPSARWPRPAWTCPLLVKVTVETTGHDAARLRDRRRAHRARAARHRPDRAELRDRPGRDERAPALPVPARPGRRRLPAQRRAAGAREARRELPADAEELADAHDTFTREYGLSLVGGCCGTTPEHLRLVVERVRGREVPTRRPRPEPGAASLYQSVPFRQDTSYLSIGERTNANGSKAFREAMLAEQLERLRRDRPRPDARRRAPARRLHRLRRAATAWPTCARSPAASRPRRRCRSCSTRPSRRWSRPGSSASAVAPSSTP